MSKLNETCPNCFGKSYRKAGVRKGKQRYRCRDCGYQFVSNPEDPRSFCGLYTVARKNFIRISVAMVESLQLKKGVSLGFSIDDDRMFVYKDDQGFDLKVNSHHIEVYENGLIKHILQHFGLDHRAGYRFEGEVKQEIWEMRKITKKNIHEVIGRPDYRRKLPPTITVMSNRIVSISRAAIDLLLLEKGDSLEIAEENGKIYIAVNTDGEFKISKVEKGATTVTTKKVSDYFINKFNIEKSDLPCRLSISEKDSIESEGLRYFEIKRTEQ